MRESMYWRRELKAEVAWLRKHRKYRRWSEKQVELYERRLMLVAFQVRSLLERSKVTDRARDSRMPVIRYRKIGNKPFTRTGAGRLEGLFDLENPKSSDISVNDVCNQLIHSYWMETISEGTAFKSMYVFSDYKRHQYACQFEIEDLIILFGVFSKDSSAPYSQQSRWDENKQEYVVVSSLGADD